MMSTRMLFITTLLTNLLDSVGQLPLHQSAECIVISTITTRPTCYDSKRGLTLVAVSQDPTLNKQALTWIINPLPDTTSRIIRKSTPTLVVEAAGQITIPDSALQQWPKFTVHIVSKACIDQHRAASLFHSFVKRRVGTSCHVWYKQGT